MCGESLSFQMSYFVERPCAVSGVSDSPTSDVSRIVREQPGFGYKLDSPGVARLRMVAG